MYQIQVSLVFLSILREDENVVDVHPYEIFQVVSKDVIYDKVYFPAKRLALVVIERPKGISHFYLSIGLSEKG